MLVAYDVVNRHFVTSGGREGGAGKPFWCRWVD